MYTSAKRDCLPRLKANASYIKQTCYNVDTRDTLVDLTNTRLTSADSYCDESDTPLGVITHFTRSAGTMPMMIAPKLHIFTASADNMPGSIGFSIAPDRWKQASSLALVKIMHDQMVRITNTDTFQDKAECNEMWRLYCFPEGIIYVDAHSRMNLGEDDEQSLQLYINAFIRIGAHQPDGASAHEKLRRFTRLQNLVAMVLVRESFVAEINGDIDRFPYVDLKLEETDTYSQRDAA